MPHVSGETVGARKGLAKWGPVGIRAPTKTHQTPARRRITHMKSTIATVATLLLLTLPCSLSGQSSKPLTNTDVVKMVKGGLPESVIISSIQSSPAKYDISPDALLALQKDGVTAKEMDAMIAESKKTPVASDTSASATPAATGHLPHVIATAGKSTVNLPL